jgi:uncharacterized protein DUF262/uncharacterized protein DUF1524
MEGQEAKSKPGSYRPEKRSIGQLLSTTSPPIVVPDWQRSYSWTVKEVETFWSDLTDFQKSNRPEYFIGSVVIVETSDGKHLLLDGQQRLATATILLSVIREYLKQYKGDAASRTQSKYLADVDDTTGELTYRLTLNTYDAEFFRRLVSSDRTPSFTEPNEERASHIHIARARDYFDEQFKEKYASGLSPKDAFEWALSIQSVLAHKLGVIAILSTDEDSAADVFETLNDRGIGLSTADLLRNLIMRRAHSSAHARIISLWDEVLSFDNDQTIKNFIRHYWVSKYGDVKTQSLYREIKTHIVENKIDSEDFSISLRDAAGLYQSILAAEADDAGRKRRLSDISDLGAGARILYPSLLAALEVVPIERQPVVFDVLINTYVRHSLIGSRENSRLENVLYGATRRLRANGDVAAFLKEIDDAAPGDEDFRPALERASIRNTREQRYVLTNIEAVARPTDELDVADSRKVHVEHIYPQTPEPGSEWANHDRWLNRLGNLTLLSGKLNSAIKNGPFEKKKPFYEKSEIQITRALVEHDAWSSAEVEARQKSLAEYGLIAWPKWNGS